jgi:hypothetical protein
VLHRIHDASLAGDAFNPGLGRPQRFSPLARADGAPIPTLYGGESFDCAAFESVFHDIDVTAPFRTVDGRAVEARAASRLVAARPLALVPLFQPDLAALRLRREWLVGAAAADFAATAAWAAAIHAAAPEADGLIWTSARCDPAWCVLLYGDRAAGALTVEATARIGAEEALLAAIRAAAARADITLVY